MDLAQMQTAAMRAILPLPGWKLAFMIDTLQDVGSGTDNRGRRSTHQQMYACFREVSGGLMRIKIAIAASVTLLATASSGAENNKACILKATETLPRIFGLVIKKTRTRPVPAAILATWQGQARPIIVDVDTVAAGAEETYSYMCVMTKGSAYVRRVMS
jgi:hypothetical protein